MIASSPDKYFCIFGNDGETSRMEWLEIVKFIFWDFFNTGPWTQRQMGCVHPIQAVLDNYFTGLNFNNMASYPLASIIF